MAFNLGSFLGNVGSAFGQSTNPYLQNLGAVGTIASGFIPQAPATMPTYGGGTAVMVSSRGGVPAVRGQQLTREVFDAGSKILARMGLAVPASSSAFVSVLKRAMGGLAAFARRTPAGTILGLLGSLGLTALETATLVGWYSVRKKSRRMNPANAKALRRAGRRIKSFHRLCQHVDLIKSRPRAIGRSRCGSCKKSPCSC